MEEEEEETSNVVHRSAKHSIDEILPDSNEESNFTEEEEATILEEQETTEVEKDHKISNVNETVSKTSNKDPKNSDDGEGSVGTKKPGEYSIKNQKNKANIKCLN